MPYFQSVLAIVQWRNYSGQMRGTGSSPAERGQSAGFGLW
jgi:hypothetical protein